MNFIFLILTIIAAILFFNAYDKNELKNMICFGLAVLLNISAFHYYELRDLLKEILKCQLG